MNKLNFTAEELIINGQNGESKINICDDLTDLIIRKCRPELPGQKIGLFFDSVLRGAHLDSIIEALSDNGFNVFSYPLAGNETTKDLATIASLVKFLSDNHFNRHDRLLALGGGVIGDTVGFTASVYMRGINYIQIPTTLLSIIDASIGGKTAVNISEAKNIIGAFHLPDHVYISLQWLQTLPEREWLSGFGEMLKYGLLHSENFFQRVINRIGKALFSPDWELLDLIRECVKIKVDVVNRDERESNFRRILNLGHTFAHALEAATNFNHFSHGEAVYIGLLAATELSVKMSLLSENVARNISDSLLSLDFRVQIPELNPDELTETMRRDKKSQGENLMFVVLEEFGLASVIEVENLFLVKDSLNFALQALRGK